MLVLKNRFEVRVTQPAPQDALIAVLDATAVDSTIPAGCTATRISVGVIAGENAAPDGRVSIDLVADKNVPVPPPIGKHP